MGDVVEGNRPQQVQVDTNEETRTMAYQSVASRTGEAQSCEAHASSIKGGIPGHRNVHTKLRTNKTRSRTKRGSTCALVRLNQTLGEALVRCGIVAVLRVLANMGDTRWRHATAQTEAYIWLKCARIWGRSKLRRAASEWPVNRLGVT